MSDAQTQLEIITDPEAFRALQSDWDALWSRANGRHHQAFAVCWLCWLHVAQPAGRQLRCIVCREHGKLVMVWPLVTYRQVFWTLLRPLTPDTAEHTSILLDDEVCAPEMIASACRAATRLSGADVFLAPYLSEGSHLHDVVRQQAGAVFLERDIAPMAKLRDETDWDTFCSTLGRLSGRKPGARERRLAKEGRVAVRLLSSESAEEYASFVDWLLACKREWAQRTGKKGAWLYSPAYRDFLINLLCPAQGDAMARLFVVTLDEAPVAALIAGIGKSCIVELISGFDAAYSAFSPGSIAIEHFVKWTLQQRKDLDFGVGSESFKAYWSRDNIVVTHSFRIANTRWGLVAIRANEAAKIFKRRISDLRSILRQTKRLNVSDGLSSEDKAMERTSANAD